MLQDRPVVAQREVEHPPLPVGVVEGHDVDFLPGGIVGLHQGVRSVGIVFQIIQLVFHLEVIQPPGDASADSSGP